MELKTNLSRILGELRMTRKELAKKANLTTNTVGAVYHDNWKHISRETIKKICTALEIDISELFELVDNEAA